MTLAVNIAQSGSNNATFRNRIINGAMVFDQRNAGASVTSTSNPFTLDRWQAFGAPGAKYTVQQNAGSVTPPVGFSKYLGVTSSSAYTVTSGDYFFLTQHIEGFNVADLNFGSANASTVTLSFWVRSSLTGTFGGSLANGTPNRSFPFTYTISVANTFEYKTITIAGDTTGTWATGNTSGLEVNFGYGVGSGLSGTANGTWQAGDYRSATGTTSVVGTNGATFYITGVQLEAGTTASPFEYRQYGTELALCQRYLPAVPSIPVGQTFAVGMCISTTAGYGFIPLPVTARVPPTGVTFTSGNTAVYNSSGTAVGLGSIGFSTATTQTATLSFGGSGLTAGNATFMLCNNTATGFHLTGCEL